ncbi:MAG: Jag N-terminal domain-containing protein [Eubacterium sp.]|nr:Jag N-terminal domain-containing protein [Eubacterium sp.]
MEFREFSGKTVEDAIIEAATTLGIASSELDIEVVSKGTSGFLGIGSKPAVIKAKAKKEVKDDIDDILATAKKPSRNGRKSSGAKKPASKPAPKKEEETKKNDKKDDQPEFTEDVKQEEKAFEEKKEEENLQPAEIDDSIIDETKQYLEKLFAAMELEASIEVALDKMTRTMSIDVEGPEMGVIIGKRGQTLDSLQYLISLFVNKKCDTYIRVKLDTENYRERRRETLENLAKNIAFKVKRSRRSFSLEPMNPYERRIIHSTLQNDRFVTTKSEGEEPYRKVVIYPKKNGNR